MFPSFRLLFSVSPRSKFTIIDEVEDDSEWEVGEDGEEEERSGDEGGWAGPAKSLPNFCLSSSSYVASLASFCCKRDLAYYQDNNHFHELN